MRRREVIAATAALLVSPPRSRAQGTRRRLGFLAVGDGSGQALNQSELALFDGLRSRGWIDGRNLSIEYRFSQPPERLPASVADLIALSPDVLLVAGPRAAAALKSATATIPIVFVAVADPLGLGFVQSLSRPGGNVTGLASNVPEDFTGKRIQLLQEIVGGASKIALLVNRGNPKPLASSWQLTFAITSATRSGSRQVVVHGDGRKYRGQCLKSVIAKSVVQ